MSGVWAGHSMTVTSFSEWNILTDFAVWHGALSCINTVGWLIAVLKLGTCFFNISLYTVALILPCSLTRLPVLATEIMPNTITLPLPNSTLILLHWVKYRSFGRRRTNLIPSQSNRLNFDSLLKWTQSHCSSVHMKCSMTNFNRHILYFFRNVRLRWSYSTVQIYFI